MDELGLYALVRATCLITDIERKVACGELSEADVPLLDQLSEVLTLLSPVGATNGPGNLDSAPSCRSVGP